MHFTIAKFSSAAAAAAVVALVATAPADAKDWRTSIDKHYDAAAQTKHTQRADDSARSFTLDTVVADMAWRQRTVRMLRDAPKPGARPAARETGQLADRPATPNLRFAF